MHTTKIPIEFIDDNPYQARTDYAADGVARLAESIQATGLLQPPMARVVADGKPVDITGLIELYSSIESLLRSRGYRVQIAFGHRRLRAFKHLGATDVPIVLTNLDDQQMYLMCYEENERRSELNPIEQAVSINMAKEQFNWTDEQIAERLKLDRSTVAKTRSLLRLPGDVQKKVVAGEISKRNAIALIPLFELPESIRAAAQKGWSDHNKPSVILKQAGTLSPTEIRQRIDNIVSANSKTITCDQEREHTDAKVESPRCTDCPLRRKRGGVTQACLNPACHDHKLEIEQQEQLMEAVRRTGLSVMDASEKDSLNWIASEHLEAFLLTPCVHRRLTTGHGVLFDKELPHCRVACAAAKKCDCSRALSRASETERNGQIRVARATREKRLKFIVEQFISRLLDRDLEVWKAVAGRHTADSLFGDDTSVEAYIGGFIFYPLTNAANTYNVRDFDEPAAKFEQWAVENFGITPYSDEVIQPSAVEPLIAQLSELEQRVNGWTFVDADEWYQCLTQLEVLKTQLTMVTGLDDINGRVAALAATLKHFTSTNNVNAATSDDEDEGNDNE